MTALDRVRAYVNEHPEHYVETKLIDRLRTPQRNLVDLTIDDLAEVLEMAECYEGLMD